MKLKEQADKLNWTKHDRAQAKAKQAPCRKAVRLKVKLKCTYCQKDFFQHVRGRVNSDGEEINTSRTCKAYAQKNVKKSLRQ